MLTVVQFPIADFRPFVCDGHRLPTPSWPPRTTLPPGFLHFFGRAAPRHKGVDWAWTDESTFCDASRALRFCNLPRPIYGKDNLRCRFRRLLSDGAALARLEVGLSYNHASQDTYTWRNWDYEIDRGSDPTEFSLRSDINPFETIKHTIALPTEVPLPNNRSQKPLLTQGASVARLFLSATGKKSSEVPWHQHIGACPPVVLVECRAHWFDQLPKSFARIPQAKTGGIELAFGRFKSPWGNVGVWLLGHGNGKVRQARSLRLCLLRLHAEQEVLDAVLQRIDTGGIEYKPHTPHGDKLENYLNQATRLINRSSWAGIDQSSILNAFDAVNARQLRSERAGLAGRLQGIRRQIRIKVERFEARSYPRSERHIHNYNAAYIETVATMTQSKTINIGAGATINAPVTIADNIERSFNNLEKGTGNADLDKLMQTLLEQITKAAQAEPKETRQLAADAETLTKEVSSEKPRRKWYELSVDGINEAAKALGDAGKPILETTARLLPLLIMLFP